MPSFSASVLRWLMKYRPFPDNVPFAQQRDIMERMMGVFPGPKQNRYEDTMIGKIPCLWMTPPNATQQVMLYFHGGAYTLGSQHTERPLAGHIALQSQARILIPHYALAPEQPFPAAIDDALACYQFLLNSGIAPQQIVVGGLSAGGGLTMALLLRLRELGMPMPRAAVLISAWLDLTGEAPSVAQNTPHDSGVSWKLLAPSVVAYAGTEDVKHPLISPVFADPTGLPPLLIQVGGAEILLDDSRVTADKAQAAGVNVTLSIYPDMIHGWHLFRFVPEARRAIREIADFIRANT